MPRAKRQIQTPGVMPTEVPEAAPETGASPHPMDDAPADPGPGDMQAALAESMRLNRELMAELRKARAEMAPKPAKPKHEVYSLADAIAASEKAIAAGKKPRALLTPEGWYVHPEYARVKAFGAKQE